MKLSLLCIVAGVAVLSMISGCTHSRARSEAAAFAPDPTPTVDKVTGGLAEPVALAFLSHDVLLVGERRTGNIRWIQAGKLRDEPFATVPPPTGAEDNGQGLLGLAVDGNYPAQPYVYVYHTVSAAAGKPLHGEILRFTVQDGKGVAAQVLVDNLPAAGGGRLLFGPDGKLYVTVGDIVQPRLKLDLAQDYTSLAGKVLRYNPDGSTPADNPFQAEQQPTRHTASNEGDADPDSTLSDISQRSPVFAIGMHNPRGITTNPSTGELYLTDGDNVIDHLIAGDNYGWPIAAGHSNLPEYHQPLWASTPSHLTPTGCAFYTGTDFPQWQGNLLFAARDDGRLRRAIFDGTDRIIAVKDVTGTANLAELDVAISPDGQVYFSSLDAIYRLRG